MAPKSKQRIDLVLVHRGLAENLSKAQAILMARQVTVNGQPIGKPGFVIDVDADVDIVRTPQYVGRGGIKLASAIAAFGIDVCGVAALDIGASTGGFTDCLLQHGATRIYAIDVGRGQLDERLRQDPRVVVMERLNARYSFQLPEMISLATVDVSFISLTKVLPVAAEHLVSQGHIIALVKPQFEAHRQEVGKGGVIHDHSTHAKVLARLIAWVITHDFRVRGLIPSPLLGKAGNREFFLLLQTQGKTRI